MLTKEANALEATAAAAIEQSKDKGIIGRWSGKRSAKKASRRASVALARVDDLLASAEQSRDDAARIQSGVVAERQVVETLANTHGVRQVLCGINLGPGVGDIDVLAIGRHPVVVEVKAGSGRLVAHADGSVTHGGRPSPGQPLSQCARQVGTLQQKAGVSSVGIVCYPNADPSVTLHTSTGCWLVGGKAELSALVTKEVTAGTDSHAQDGRTIVSNVQHHLGLRQQEVLGWVKDSATKDREAFARIAKWQDTISRSSSWSNGAAIRAGLTQRIADNEATVSRRAQKVVGWKDLAAKIGTAMKSNDQMLRGL